MEITLENIKRTDLRILNCMKKHYSKPKGFVGRNICYTINYNNTFYGCIAGGSATLHLPNRNEYFNITNNNLKGIINNIFYHIEKVDNKYPIRWFTVKVLNVFLNKVTKDWEKKYGDIVIGYESLVQLPRNGTIYRKDGWHMIGVTKGYSCKRISGKGTDNWSGKRVWDTKDLKPKLVFVKKR